jgi:uncharacterized protein (DUF433 family)
MNLQANLLTRITQIPGQCGGYSCIRGMRIRVTDILEMLAENVTITDDTVYTLDRHDRRQSDHLQFSTPSA